MATDDISGADAEALEQVNRQKLAIAARLAAHRSCTRGRVSLPTAEPRQFAWARSLRPNHTRWPSAAELANELTMVAGQVPSDATTR